MVLSSVKTSPSPRFLDAVCREFNVNTEWLKSGKGDSDAKNPRPAPSPCNSVVEASYQGAGSGVCVREHIVLPLPYSLTPLLPNLTIDAR